MKNSYKEDFDNLENGVNEKTISNNALLERWRYPRFFSETPLENKEENEVITILGEDLKHIKNVLRMKTGDISIIVGTDCFEAFCILSFIDNKEAVFSIKDVRYCDRELSVYIRLFMCVPKGEKLDFIVQKATELGVSEIIPIISTRCISRPDKKSAGNKIIRFQKIAKEASKQSGRGKIPLVREFCDFNKALEMHSDCENGILFYECGGKKVSEIININQSFRNLDIIVGSEGGFTKEEVLKAEKAGYIIGSLGKLILRTETAAITSLSQIIMFF